MPEVARSKTNELHPLGVHGQRVIDLHQQLTGLLRARLGPSHAALFAEPVSGRSGDEIVWYIDLTGRVTKLSEAPDAERSAGEARLAELIGEIEEQIESLESSGDAASEFNAESLRQALVCPEDSLYLVGDQPVIVNWGCRLATEDVAPTELIRMGRRAAPPSALPAAAAVPPGARPADEGLRSGPVVAARPRRSLLGWLWWLLSALVIAAILIFLLRACQPGFLVTADKTDDGALAALADVRAEEARLREEIEDLTRKLHFELAQCRVPEPTEQVTEMPEPEPPPLDEEPPQEIPEEPPLEEEEVADEATERVLREGGSIGRLSVTLLWNSTHDLDLHVETPAGERIYFGRKQSRGGGSLDIDMNARGEVSTEPVENVTWSGEPPQGRYKVYVTLHKVPDAGDWPDPTQFEIHVRKGDEVETAQGQIYNRQERQGLVLVYEFDVP